MAKCKQKKIERVCPPRMYLVYMRGLVLYTFPVRCTTTTTTTINFHFLLSRFFRIKKLYHTLLALGPLSRLYLFVCGLENLCVCQKAWGAISKWPTFPKKDTFYHLYLYYMCLDFLKCMKNEKRKLFLWIHKRYVCAAFSGIHTLQWQTYGFLKYIWVR